MSELAAQTVKFKEQIAQGAPLDDLLIPAFATVREAGRRFLNMRHFDVQLIGGIVLHRGKIAEMKTGEGKTLVATLAVYLNALEGKGVHVVTVNDYLAKRDSEWMGRIYKALGMSVGNIVHDLSDEERHDSYHRDITYGTNNEFGFDYLRDNMKFRLRCVQRFAIRSVDGRTTKLSHAIVDEVDSILIDEARTPLIISGPSEESTDKYYRINRIIPNLIRGEVIEGKEPGVKWTTGDYTVEERTRTVALTEEGVAQSRAASGPEQSLRRHQYGYEPSRAAGPEGQRDVPARPRLRGEGRRSHHRRRIHRPPDAGTPLERRSAPGGGSERRREDPARESDARHHHFPELLPHV